MGQCKDKRIWIRSRLTHGERWTQWQPSCRTRASEIERNGGIIGQIRYEVARGPRPEDSKHD